MQLRIIIGLIMLFISCKENVTNKNTVNENGLNNVDNGKNDLIYQKITYDNIIKIEFDKLDLLYLKNTYGRNSTSGVLPKDEKEIFPQLNDEAFYGVYFFPNNNLKINRAIDFRLIVEVNSKDWKFDNINEKLVEMIVFTSEFEFFNKLKVGSKKEELKNIFEDIVPNFIDAEKILYKIDNYEFGVVLDNDLIKEIRIGKYKDW